MRSVIRIDHSFFMKISIGWFGLLLGAGLNVLPLRAQQHRTERQNPTTRSLHEGLAAVSPDGKQWGLMDLRGNIVLPDTEYDYIWPLQCSNGRYYYGVEKNDRYGVLEAGTWRMVVPWDDYASDEALCDGWSDPQLKKQVSIRVKPHIKTCFLN